MGIKEHLIGVCTRVSLLMLAPMLCSASDYIPPEPMPQLVRVIDDVNGERWYSGYEVDVILATDNSHPGIPNPGIAEGFVTVASYLPDGTLEIHDDRLRFTARWTQYETGYGNVLFIIADQDRIGAFGFESVYPDEFIWSEYRLVPGCNPRVQDCRV